MLYQHHCSSHSVEHVSIVCSQGIYCEIDKDDCENVLCEMGARCRDLVNDYMCECPSGYIGKRCEIEPNYCVNVTCLNGGSCVPLHSSYVCDCLDGYSGMSLEVVFYSLHIHSLQYFVIIVTYCAHWPVFSIKYQIFL